MQWIQENAAALKALLAVMTFAATVVLLWLNTHANRLSHRSMEEMHSTHDEESRPRVVFFLDASSGSQLEVVVQNVGRSEALDVKIEFDQDFRIWYSLMNNEQEFTLKDLALVDGIDMLAPGEEQREWIDYSFRFFQKSEATQLTGCVTYQDLIGRTFTFPIDIDLTMYKSFAVREPKDMSDLNRVLEEIGKRLTDGY
ncbi:MAG: hypothetical protein H6833_07375 [Planctomycetes bacterium]|nr:hypothetical protein [Planctomycetota bacterium]